MNTQARSIMYPQEERISVCAPYKIRKRGDLRGISSQISESVIRGKESNTIEKQTLHLEVFREVFRHSFHKGKNNNGSPNCSNNSFIDH